MAERAYKPSERVPTSGVYRVTHNGHRTSHEAMLLEGAAFPECANCGLEARFTLVHPTHSLSEDPDFRRR